MDIPRKYRNVVWQMSSEQVVEYFTSQRDNLDPKVAQLPLLSKPWIKFKGCVTKLEDIYKRPKALPQTAKIVMYEEVLDNEFIYISNYVYNILQHSSFAAELAAARVLEPILRNHAGLTKLEYESETAAITDLIAILEAAGIAEHVATLGLTAHVANFKQLNLNFKASYKERSDTRYEHKLEGSLAKYRKEASDAFAVFVESVNSLRSMYTEPTQLGLLEEIVISMNATTYQFSLIVHRHLGYLASKKDPQDPNPEVPGEGGEEGEGGDEGDGGDEGEGGDGEDGGDGHETPDITNPEVPFE